MKPTEPIELVGLRFGRLVVISEAPRDKYNHRCWACKCDCGGSVVTRGYGLKCGDTHSCGCLAKDTAIKTHTTHGLTNTKTGKAWNDMKARCLNPNNRYWKHYGGRGIKICAAILGNGRVIVDAIGLAPDGLTLDRVDNSKGYTCGKCKDCKKSGHTMNLRWATKCQQMRNTRRNRLLTIGGIKKCVSEWAEQAGINAGTLSGRISLGWRGARLLLPARKTSRIYK